MKFSHISKIVAISALALLSFACSNTKTQSQAQATSTPKAVASASPASGPPAAALSQSWTLINFGAPW